MTETQHKLLQYLRECGEVTPTYREMAAHLGWSSWGGVKAVIDGLIAHGYVKRVKGKDRGLRVVKEKSPWLPIATAPRGMKTEVLLCGCYPEVRGWSDVYHSWFIPGEGWARWPHDFAPTHWMPLPEAPDA